MSSKSKKERQKELRQLDRQLQGGSGVDYTKVSTHVPFPDCISDKILNKSLHATYMHDTPFRSATGTSTTSATSES